MQKIGASTNTADSFSEFTEGNATQGVYATFLTAEWLNTLQRELIAVVEKSGLVLDPDKDDQVYTAIRTLVRSGSSNFAIDTGTVNAYIVDYAPSVIVPVNGMSLRFMAKTSNTASSTIDINGLGEKPLLGSAQLPLQAGEIVVGGIAEVVYSIVLDSWVLLECTGANPQVPDATQPLHALNLAQGRAMANKARSAIYINASAAIIPGIYLVDTSTGTPITLTLPSDPSPGDLFTFIDANNSWDIHNWTLARNGHPIAGRLENLNVDLANQQWSLWYNDTTWVFV